MISLLWPVIKKLLCLSHGQASVERGVSVNKYTMEDNLSNEGLIARRLVADHIKSVGGVLKVHIDNALELSCKAAKHKYDSYLADKKARIKRTY